MTTNKVVEISIKSPGKMSADERRDVVSWLEEAARKIQAEGGSLTEGKFTLSFGYYRD